MTPRITVASVAVSVAVFSVTAVSLFAAVTSARSSSRTDAPRDDRAAFARPDGLPVGSALSQAAVDLGRVLFSDPRLSGDGTMSCATCHQDQLAFADGQARHTGRDGKPLTRHTPHLWNLAWSETLFWDGRAKSLEAQARGPIENAQEMAAHLPDVVTRLAGDPATVARFASAFPDTGPVTADNLLAALAAYERSLVSPVTRFDRWVAGDAQALDDDEQKGFRLFTRRGQCSACHSGWRFTDEAFHDIGLPDTGDLGRGTAIALKAADHAFKTPSLREVTWTAPYMHDGSLSTLEAVIDHYARGGERRATLSKDMPPVVRLNEEERQQLVAFLGTLSSESPPRPPQTVPTVQMASIGRGEAPVATLSVGQKDKRFTPRRVALKAGQSLTIVNDDKRTHNVRVDDPRMTFTSNAQEPGDSVLIAFPDPGEFGVICSIHPTMKLTVTVEAKTATAK
jgi:cytochrome c peroxidase